MRHAIAPQVTDVYITEGLYRRNPGKIDILREKKALQEIAALMADDPAQVLPKFVSLAMEMTDGVSAGLSLFEENPAPGIFVGTTSQARSLASRERPPLEFKPLRCRPRFEHTRSDRIFRARLRLDCRVRRYLAGCFVGSPPYRQQRADRNIVDCVR